jgi:hypothetical protein
VKISQARECIVGAVWRKEAERPPAALPGSRVPRPLRRGSFTMAAGCMSRSRQCDFATVLKYIGRYRAMEANGMRGNGSKSGGILLEHRSPSKSRALKFECDVPTRKDSRPRGHGIIARPAICNKEVVPRTLRSDPTPRRWNRESQSVARSFGKAFFLSSPASITIARCQIQMVFSGAGKLPIFRQTGGPERKTYGTHSHSTMKQLAVPLLTDS